MNWCWGCEISRVNKTGSCFKEESTSKIFTKNKTRTCWWNESTPEKSERNSTKNQNYSSESSSFNFSSLSLFWIVKWKCDILWKTKTFFISSLLPIAKTKQNKLFFCFHFFSSKIIFMIFKILIFFEIKFLKRELSLRKWTIFFLFLFFCFQFNNSFHLKVQIDFDVPISVFIFVHSN